MARKKIMFGVGAGIACLAIDGLYGLLILRFLLKYLNADVAGLWTLVMTAGSLLVLLQWGMGPVISREIARVSERTGDEGTTEMGRLLAAISRAFVYLTISVPVVGAVVFLLYLLPLAEKCENVLESVLAWLAYCLGVSLNLWGLSNLFIINGFGEVGWDKILRGTTVLGGILSAWITLKMGGGIVGLGLVYFLQNLAFFYACRRLRMRICPRTSNLGDIPKSIVNRLFRDGSRILLLSVLTYFVNNVGQFLVEKNFGLAMVPKFTAATRIIVLLGTIGALVPQMIYPHISRAWSAGKRETSRRYYLIGIGASVTLFTVAMLPIVVWRHSMFNMWLGNGSYIGDGPFYLLLIHQLIAVHHSAHATATLATNGDAFTTVSIINAVMVVSLMLYLPQRLGVAGVPIAMIIGTVPASFYVVKKAWCNFKIQEAPIHATS
jgi:O-antigen/teichoic acid export membrane protein